MRMETEEATLIDVSVHTTAENSGLGKECKNGAWTRETDQTRYLCVRPVFVCILLPHLCGLVGKSRSSQGRGIGA